MRTWSGVLKGVTLRFINAFGGGGGAGLEKEFAVLCR